MIRYIIVQNQTLHIKCNNLLYDFKGTEDELNTTISAPQNSSQQLTSSTNLLVSHQNLSDSIPEIQQDKMIDNNLVDAKRLNNSQQVWGF